VQAIHSLGTSPDTPFVDLNCGALPASLLESQLFGHEKGAFTGADARHVGYLAAVGYGTLFLDEIGELEPALQAKLLRVLEARTFRSVGSTTEQRFLGRVIAATHVDLEQGVREGRFREDLYYRLNVLTLRVPSLDERREDIPALVAHFAAHQEIRMSFTSDAIATLAAAQWPGNVRQLRNIVDRLAVMHDGQIDAAAVRAVMELGDQPPNDPIRELARLVLRLDSGDKLALVERALVEEAMREAQANKSGAARLLGVHRKVVERLMQRAQDQSSIDPADKARCALDDNGHTRALSWSKQAT
jgi:DNA-binding NtrC family response regulator